MTKQFGHIFMEPKMASFNKAMIMGNLGTKPELRTTKAGTSVTTIRVATNEVSTDSEGQRTERTEWHSVVVFGKTAENCEKYLDKGSSVLVEGRIQTREWEDKDGVKKYSTEIVASSVQFIGGRDKSEDADEPAAKSKPAAAKGGKAAPAKPSKFDDDDIPF